MKTDTYRLERISLIGHQLLDVVQSRGITSDSLYSDIETQWLVTTPLYNIGEQVNCVSRSLTDAHTDVPWSQIAGLRHRLVHDYEGVNWEIISTVLFEELEPFIAQVDDILVGKNSAD